ncbi:MAG: hypothetical protein LBK82_15970 [Planctomycetaceae bacterium]|nr:hypothetical protein [Planctomycetaceae bacterium]
MGNPPAGRLRRLSLHFAVINLIHSRRVRRRNLSAKGCPPISVERLRKEKNRFRQLPKVSGRKKIVFGNRRKSPEGKKSFSATAGSLRKAENRFRQPPKGCGNTNKRL